MLAVCRLAGLSALGAHYAGVKWPQCGADARHRHWQRGQTTGRDRCPPLHPPHGSFGGWGVLRGVGATAPIKRISPRAFCSLISNAYSHSVMQWINN